MGFLLPEEGCKGAGPGSVLLVLCLLEGGRVKQEHGWEWFSKRNVICYKDDEVSWGQKSLATNVL